MLLCLVGLLTLQATSLQDVESFTVDALIYMERDVVYRYFEMYSQEWEEWKTSVYQYEERALLDGQYFMSEIRKYFRRLQEDHGLHIHIRFRPLKFLGGDIIDEDPINATDALKKFRNWQSKDEYDLAILWTRVKLCRKGKKEIFGKALRAKVCNKPKNTGIVKYTFTYRTVLLTVRQIAKILGATFDKGNLGYIMNNRIGPLLMSQKRWHFSLCSAQDIRHFLLRKRCVWNQNKDISLPEDDVRISKFLEDPNEVCKLFRQSNAYEMCMFQTPESPEWKYPTGDEICRQICCIGSTSSKPKNQYEFTPEGLLCGAGRRCHEGLCKVDRSGRSYHERPASCPFGDQRLIHYQVKDDDSVLTQEKVFRLETCGEAMLNHGYGKQVCYNFFIRRYEAICCETCKNVSTTIPNCRYGDLIKVCPKKDCPHDIGNCCETCHGVPKEI